MSKWTRSEIDEIRLLLNEAIDDVDDEILRSIRRNEPPGRETLLGQLDVLEKVRERLNVRYDRFTFDQ